MSLPASSCMEWAEWWGRYLNNLTSGKGRYPANSGITSMWTLWIARGATGIEITPELFPHTAQLLLLSTTARTKRKHYKDLLWKKWRTLRIVLEHFEICIWATPKSPPAFIVWRAVQGKKTALHRRDHTWVSSMHPSSLKNISIPPEGRLMRRK